MGFHYFLETHHWMMVKQEMNFGPFQGTSFTVITLNRETNCTYREKNHSQFHFEKYIDVIRTTHTNLDVMYWNIEGNRDPSYSWTRVHTIHHIGQELPDGLTWSGERLTKKQTTSRPDQFGPETWKDMSEATQQKKRTIEKPKLGSARRLRGIHFIDPAGADFKETIRNARKKLEVPMPAAMPCKIRRRTCKELVANLDAPKT